MIQERVRAGLKRAKAEGRPRIPAQVEQAARAPSERTEGVRRASELPFYSRAKSCCDVSACPKTPETPAGR